MMDSILHFYGMMFSGLQVIIITIVAMLLSAIVSTIIACFVYRQDVVNAKRTLQSTQETLIKAYRILEQGVESSQSLNESFEHFADVFDRLEVKIEKAKADTLRDQQEARNEDKSNDIV